MVLSTNGITGPTHFVHWSVTLNTGGKRTCMPRLASQGLGAELSHRTEGLTREQLLQAFRLMHTSRRIDDREILLKRQNRIYFQISGAGHEAIQIAAAYAMRAGVDWFYPYYRDRALALTLAVSAAD